MGSGAYGEVVRILANKECPKPKCWANLLITTGPSCRGSPANIACPQPILADVEMKLNGIKASGSVDCRKKEKKLMI